MSNLVHRYVVRRPKSHFRKIQQFRLPCWICCLSATSVSNEDMCIKFGTQRQAPFWIFSLISVSNENICGKFGKQIDLVMWVSLGVQNHTFGKIQDVANWTKFGMPMQNEMPMTIAQSDLKSEVEFHYGGYGTDFYTVFQKRHLFTCTITSSDVAQFSWFWTRL